MVGRHNGSTWEVTETSSKSCSAPFSATASGFTALSPFAIGNEAALPVELTDFTASLHGASVELSWHTASETNNSHFEIERSASGRDWAAIGAVQGWGTTLEPQDYAFTDRHPLFGQSYYRLKQMDFDGTFGYSKIVPVYVKNEVTLTFIYPNPVKEFIFWNLAAPNTGYLAATLIDPKGSVWYRQGISGNSLDVSVLPPGIYFLLLENEERQPLLRERFVKK